MLSITIEEDKEVAVAKEATGDATAVSGLAESDDILPFKDVRKTIFCLNRLWQEFEAQPRAATPVKCHKQEASSFKQMALSASTLTDRNSDTLQMSHAANSQMDV